MRKVLVASVVILLCLGGIAQADVFNLGPGLTNLEMVPVGDPGNNGELSGAGAGGSGPDRICGAMGYTYNIGKYEVTAAQYTDFLNAKAKADPYGLYNTSMTSTYGCNIQRSGSDGSYVYSVASEWANRPVNFVSYWDALRFVNWLNNGQGNGDTETGAYTLNGYNGDDGRTIQRNAGGTWWLTSEDEWYKAAYYKGGGINAGYWDYPTQNEVVPSNDLVDPDPGNNANYYQSGWTIGDPYYHTKVGEFENSESAYGTFDQGGNVWEWNEAIVYQGGSYAYRGLRGSSFNYRGSDSLRASVRGRSSPPTYEGDPGNDDGFGFRVAMVPEPSSLLALASGLAGLGGVALRRRKR